MINISMMYKINLRNTIKVLSATLIYHVVFILFYVYGLYNLDDGSGVYAIIFAIGYAVSMLPTILLHVEYYLKNKADVVYIDSKEKSITINKDRTIQFDEVEKIILYMPPCWNRNDNFRYYPFEDYRYSQIQIRGGDKYLFTCLMDFNIDKVMAKFVGVPIEKKVRLIASPLIENLLSGLTEAQ
jgi:hypothetical protein